VNTNLQDFGRQINSLEELAGSGLLVILIGIVGKFFVPLDQFHIDARDDKQRQINAKVAMHLLTDLGIDVNLVKEQDMLMVDVKSISRTIFFLQQN
jgi:hypothetical protein